MSQSRRATKARATALLGVGTLLVGGGLTGLAPGGATASSHREAPAIAGQPQYDNTDVYAFVDPSQNGKVNIVSPTGSRSRSRAAARTSTRGRPTRGTRSTSTTTTTPSRTSSTPGSSATPARRRPSDSFTGNGTFLYNNGPVTSLKDKNLLFRQTYTSPAPSCARAGQDRTLLNNAPVAPSHVGDAAMPNYNALRNAAVKTFKGGRQSFAGQAEDPFFLDLRVFDVLYGGDCMTEAGHDSLAGFNVNSLALQVPRGDLIAKGQDVVGIWSTTDRKNSSGCYKQVSRLGQPLVNEVVDALPGQGHVQLAQARRTTRRLCRSCATRSSRRR